MLDKVTWAVIYANIPLVIAVGLLAFLFQQWETVKLMLWGNILVLLTLSILRWRANQINIGQGENDYTDKA